MIKVGLISDTHGYFDPQINDYFADCNEIWHAGDFGTVSVAESLQAIAPVTGVYGNVDGRGIRDRFAKNKRFEKEGLQFWMTHIGGTLGRYCLPVRKELENARPDVFICGHSHMLQIGRDEEKDKMLFINPGAAGRQGSHKKRTLVRFTIARSKIKDVEVVELGKRSARP